MRKSILNQLSAGLFLLGMLAFAACSTSKMKTLPSKDSQSMDSKTSTIPSSQVPSPVVGVPEVMGPPEPFGPPAPEVSPVRPAVIVLGPGLARGFAYVGVFRALHEAKISIGAVLGTEIGSLFAALYALSSNMNQFEWGLLRFKEDVFTPQNSLLAKLKGGPSDGTEFEGALRQVFGKKDLKQAKVSVQVALQARDTGILIVLDQGAAVNAIRAAMSVPRLFKEVQWPPSVDGVNVISNVVRPFLISEARALNLGPVIVINVLSDAEARSFSADLKAADLVIKPDLTGIGYMDFRKRTEAAFRGETAMQQRIREIKELTGTIEGDSSSSEASP